MDEESAKSLFAVMATLGVVCELVINGLAVKKDIGATR